MRGNGMKRHVLTLMVVGMVAAACTSGEDPAPSPPPDAMPPTPTEVETDNAPAGYSATEIPAVEDIDLAYVQWVIADAITPVIDEAIRLEVEAGLAGASEPPPMIFEMYGAVAGGEHLQFTSRTSPSMGVGFDEWDIERCPRLLALCHQRAMEILDATTMCLMIVFERDLSPQACEQPTETVGRSSLSCNPNHPTPTPVNAQPIPVASGSVKAPLEFMTGDTAMLTFHKVAADWQFSSAPFCMRPPCREPIASDG
jgi:hypothetical protein